MAYASQTWNTLTRQSHRHANERLGSAGMIRVEYLQVVVLLTQRTECDTRGIWATVTDRLYPDVRGELQNG
jgi:hypothetical protein